jgi:hypothetical protein
MSVVPRGAERSGWLQGTRLPVRWVLACAGGGALGVVLAAVAGWAGLILFGVAVGLPQWLVLRQHVAHAWRWVPLTGVGVFVGWWVGAAVAMSWFLVLAAWFMLARELGLDEHLLQVLGDSVKATVYVVGGAAAGAVVGGCQLLVLRALGRGAHRWLWVSVVGGAVLGLPIDQVVSVARSVSLPRPEYIAPATPALVAGVTAITSLAGGIYGVLTSIVLARLLGARRVS